MKAADMLPVTVGLNPRSTLHGANQMKDKPQAGHSMTSSFCHTSLITVTTIVDTLRWLTVNKVHTRKQEKERNNRRKAHVYKYTMSFHTHSPAGLHKACCWPSRSQHSTPSTAYPQLIQTQTYAHKVTSAWMAEPSHNHVKAVPHWHI